MIGPSGSRINAIIEQFGGADKIKVKFRSQSLLSEGESADDVTIKAHKDTIPKVKLEIERLVQSVGGGGSGGGDSADEVSEQIVRIPRKDVSRVVESGGKGLKEIMGKFNVNIWIIDVDEKAEDGSLVSDVRIVGSGSGKEADVEAAKEIVLVKGGVFVLVVGKCFIVAELFFLLSSLSCDALNPSSSPNPSLQDSRKRALPGIPKWHSYKKFLKRFVLKLEAYTRKSRLLPMKWLFVAKRRKLLLLRLKL